MFSVLLVALLLISLIGDLSYSSDIRQCNHASHLCQLQPLFQRYRGVVHCGGVEQCSSSLLLDWVGSWRPLVAHSHQVGPHSTTPHLHHHPAHTSSALVRGDTCLDDGSSVGGHFISPCGSCRPSGPQEIGRVHSASPLLESLRSQMSPMVIGSIGNGVPVTADSTGVAAGEVVDTVLKLNNITGVIGRSIIVHGDSSSRQLQVSVAALFFFRRSDRLVNMCMCVCVRVCRELLVLLSFMPPTPPLLLLLWARDQQGSSRSLAMLSTVMRPMSRAEATSSSV